MSPTFPCMGFEISSITRRNQLGRWVVTGFQKAEGMAKTSLIMSPHFYNPGHAPGSNILDIKH